MLRILVPLLFGIAAIAGCDLGLEDGSSPDPMPRPNVERDPPEAGTWDWQPTAAGSSVTLYTVCRQGQPLDCYSCTVTACKSVECEQEQRRELGDLFPTAESDPTELDFCVPRQ